MAGWVGGERFGSVGGRVVYVHISERGVLLRGIVDKKRPHLGQKRAHVGKEYKNWAKTF